MKETSTDRELTVPPAGIEELKTRPWPGNVRELSNACERMAILCRGNEVSLGDLPPAASKARGAEAAAGAEGSGEEWPPLPPGGLSLVDLEKKVIERALRLKGGNITQAPAYLPVPL